MGFAHLHVHSNFSFGDGASPPADLAARAATLGMGSLALTNHDGFYGSVSFAQACKLFDLQPVYGAELNVDGDHLTLLAEDRRGYANLGKVITRAHLDSPEDKSVPLATLAKHSQGVICLSGCRRGRLCRLLREGKADQAVEYARQLAETFGRDNFWVELQDNRLPLDRPLNQQLAEVARRAGVGCVATGNAHYAEQKGHRLHDVLTCVRTHTRLDEWGPERRLNSEYYLLSEAEMRELFTDFPMAVDVTEEIAARCRVDLTATRCTPPAFAVPAPHTPETFLRQLCLGGLEERYAGDGRAPAEAKLDYELSVIHRLDLNEFFLCVWDICRFAKERGIRYAGRGSAANSIVAYTLGITKVDPLEHDLLFERFLNPERIGMPDIDVDFATDRRDKVIVYVEDKYGESHAAMVANLITYRGRSAIRDVGKTLGMEPDLINRLAKTVGWNEANEIASELRQAFPELCGQHQFELLIELCGELAHFPRHLGLHNGGMVISRAPITDVIPVQRSANGVRVCQVDKDGAEALGLIKFDILGLRSLAILDDTARMLAESGVALAVDRLPLDDAETWALLREGRTIGIFQVESAGQERLIKLTKPATLRDLVIQVSLFRPGPIQGGFVHPYVARRSGQEPVMYPDPCLEPILKDTWGIILFQEQVLQIAHDFAGLSYGEADGFRRAMSHYRAGSAMDAMRDRFIEGALVKGRDRATAEWLFEKLSRFTGYGFCRSHAAAFAITVYQMAYLKAHYPAHLFGAILNNQPALFYPPVMLISELRRMGYAVLPVDMNRSEYKYTVEGEALRIGLLQVKEMNEAQAQTIVERRADEPYRSLEDFCRRTQLNEDVIHNLIQAGAFDCWGYPRRTLLWQLREIQRTLGDVRRSRQVELLTDLPVSPIEQVPPLPVATAREQMQGEYAVQAVSAGPHLMEFYRPHLDEQLVDRIGDLPRRRAGQTVSTAGIIMARQRPPTAHGMCFIILDDESGHIQVAAPPHVYERYKRVIRGSIGVVVTGRLESSQGHLSVLVQTVRPVEGVPVANQPFTHHSQGVLPGPAIEEAVQAEA